MDPRVILLEPQHGLNKIMDRSETNRKIKTSVDECCANKTETLIEGNSKAIDIEQEGAAVWN
jgi:hypothetical protein